MLSGLSSFLFGNQRKDDDKKKPVSRPEAEDKGEWLLVNSSGDTVDIDTASADALPTASGVSASSDAFRASGVSASSDAVRASDATAASGTLTASGASLLEDTLTDENLPSAGERDHFALTVDISHHQDNFFCSSSTLSTPAKSDTSSDDVSDFERYRGPYVSMRDLESHSDTGLSDVSSQPEHVAHPSMDEEWLVTPPPCFTSPAGRRGSASAAAAAAVAEQPKTNSLENLLIEHPSMSVYYPSAARGGGGRRQTSPLSSVMSDSCRSGHTTDSLTSEDNESLFGGVENNRYERRFPSPPEWHPAEMPGLEIAQRGGVPRPIHHQPVIDLLAAAGGTDVAVLEWKGKTRVERRVLSRSAIDQNNRVRNHDAQFKLRRQGEHARRLPTNGRNKGKF